jgi:putative ABC transport system ATP-binding protein
MSQRLKLIRLTKTVPGRRVLFQNLNLQIGSGELVAIIGESGSGKSTLLNIIAGLDQADSGELLIDDESLTNLTENDLTDLRRRKIGFVFQAFHILPYITLKQNVALPLAIGKTDSGEALRLALAMLDHVGLGSRGEDFPRDLSGGELQRVAIARALVNNPALILADEPTGNLDPETAARILSLFAQATRERGAATVIVTHSLTAAQSADRILVLTPAGLQSYNG